MALLKKTDFFEAGKEKTASAGKYSGKTRKQIVLEKIKNISSKVHILMLTIF